VRFEKFILQNIAAIKKESFMPPPLKKAIFTSLVLIFIFPCFASADDFFDIIGYQVQGVGEDKTFNNQLYAAMIRGAWKDYNEDGRWDKAEAAAVIERLNGTLEISNSFGDRIESDPGLTREELEEWAEQHADEILDIIFPGGITQATGITDDGIMNQGLLSGKLFKKAIPASKKDQMDKLNDEFKGALEYLFLEVDDNDGGAGSIVLGYAHDSDNGLELGFMLPYRYSFIDDAIDSTSHFVGLDVYGKYPVAKWDDMAWNIGADAVGSVFYLKSDAIEYSGNYKYGGGVFSSFVADFNFGGTLSIGVDYKITQAHLSDGLIDTDNEFLEEAIDWVNDLDAVQTLSYGFSFGIPAGESAAFNLEVIRSNFSSDDIPDDRDSQTIAGLSLSYFPTETFELNLGVHKTFELEDIDSTGIVLGTIYRY
jgi:hypothetical protein